MSLAICANPYSLIMMEPSHKCEITSQLVFGEMCEILEGDKKWVRVRCGYDSYEGWCLPSQLKMISQEQNVFNQNNLASDWLNEIVINGKKMMLPFGSYVPENEFSTLEDWKIEYKGKYWNKQEAVVSHHALRKIAFTYLNTTYVWGGKTIFGIDCSGFVQSVYKFFNIPILRDAKLQARQGMDVGFLQEAICGDLAFFDDEYGEIVHVGMLLNDHEIIHASGKVRIDAIDNEGIINSDTELRTHKLRVIKRFFEY